MEVAKNEFEFLKLLEKSYSNRKLFRYLCKCSDKGLQQLLINQIIEETAFPQPTADGAVKNFERFGVLTTKKVKHKLMVYLDKDTITKKKEIANYFRREDE